MEVVVVVDTLEGYVCTLETTGAFVGCTLIVVGEVVGPVVPAGGYSAALAG